MASSAVKEPPEATATPEPLSDEDLPLDPDLYQDFCAGAFDDHGLVSRQHVPWWKGGGYRSRVSIMRRGGRGYGRLFWDLSRWSGSHEWGRWISVCLTCSPG